MIRKTIVFSLLLLATGFSALGGTKFLNTWKNPEAAPTNWRGKKVVAFTITFLNAARPGAEESLARELSERGAQGIAGYTLVPKEIEKDTEKVRAILEEAGVAGAVVMRVMSADNEVFSSPGTIQYTASYYPSFWGYWGYGYSAQIYPGHMTADKVYVIETLVYSVERNQLLWAGTSKSTNPKNVDKFLKQLVDAVGKQIRKAGLVSK